MACSAMAQIELCAARVHSYLLQTSGRDRYCNYATYVVPLFPAYCLPFSHVPPAFPPQRHCPTPTPMCVHAYLRARH